MNGRSVGDAISRRAALYQSLAASGATLIAFIGFCHEVAGHLIFPWGPDFLGGPIGWHATGLSAIALGLVLLAGTLRLIAIPVVALSLVAVAAGLFFLVVTAVLFHEFHSFALAGVLAGCLTAWCHRRAGSAS